MLLMASVLAPPRATAQNADRLYTDAMGWAEAGDTVIALALLRKAVDADADHPGAVFALGTLLARTALTTEKDFVQRQEAEDLLNRAFRLRDGDPAVLIELGLLKRKQNIRVDSRRLLENALDSDKITEIDPRRAADGHYQLARVLEEELADFEQLVFLGDGFQHFGDGTGTFCPDGVTFFCNNYTRTKDFNAQLESAGTASDRARDYPPRIEDHYREALSFYPRHEMAARGLMGLYYKSGRTADFRTVAEDLIALAPGQAYPHLFLGLSYYADERWDAAKQAFYHGLGLLPPPERRAFDDVGMLLQAAQRAAYSQLPVRERERYEEILWAKSDPLYLIPENERWMEHVARVAYAELNFGAPELGMRGWETDRGLIYIRYGLPRRIWMVALETSTAMTAGGGSRARFVFWNYRPDAPNFIFLKQLGYRNVRFDLASNAAGYARELAEAQSPSVFRSRAVNVWVDMPHQIARFRGTQPDRTQVVAFLTADPERFQLFEGDSVTAAMFIFAPEHADSADLRRSIPAGTSGDVAFSTELFPAEYDYAIEALAPQSKVAGSERGTLPVRLFTADSLSLSDLVVADGVVPRVPEPVRWTDFSIGASRDLEFSPEQPIHLYLEVYGLETNRDGEARYTMELTVTDAGEKGVVSRLVGRLGQIFGGGGRRDTRLRFERTAQARQGIVPEYLSLTLEDVEPGSYRVKVKVKDEESDREAVVSRVVTITP